MATIEPATSPAGYDVNPMTEKGKSMRNLVEADLLDERYATTQRGLKNRHVQLMALGGTIGTGKSDALYQPEEKSDILTGLQRSLRIFWSIFGHWRPCFIAPRLSFHLGHGLRTCHSHRRNRRLSPCSWWNNELSWVQIRF